MRKSYYIAIIPCSVLLSFAFILNPALAATEYETSVNDEFEIDLKSNPTTGYQWRAHYDPEYINLLKENYIPDSPNRIGSGGKSIFRFRPLKKGYTVIYMIYKRPWLKEKHKQKTYQIHIR